jgi:hypothetical protein
MPDEKELIEEQELQEEEVSTQETDEHEIYEPEPEEEFATEPETPQQEEDWRLRAMQDPRVRERFDQALFGQQQEQVYEAPVDPVEQARSRLNELDSSMPTLDENNMTAEQVTKFMNWQNERNRAAQELADARIEMTQRQVQAQQARSSLEDYIQSAKAQDRDFKNYETQFREYVRENNIDPRLLQNRQVMEMIRKAIGYDQLKGRRRAKAPGAPPVDESYTRQGQQAKRRKAEAAPKLREPTELDYELAAFYRQPVEEYLADEQKFAADRERWSMEDSVQWSDEAKLRRAGFRR